MKCQMCKNGRGRGEKTAPSSLTCVGDVRVRPRRLELPDGIERSTRRDRESKFGPYSVPVCFIMSCHPYFQYKDGEWTLAGYAITFVLRTHCERKLGWRGKAYISNNRKEQTVAAGDSVLSVRRAVQNPGWKKQIGTR